MVAALLGSFLMEEAKLAWRASRNLSVHLNLQLLQRIGMSRRRSLRLTSAARSIRLEASPWASAHPGSPNSLIVSSSISSKVVIT